MLVVFLSGYYIKFYYLSLLNERPAGLLELTWINASDPEVLFDTFRLVTIGFAIFAGTSWVAYMMFGVASGGGSVLRESRRLKSEQDVLRAAGRTVITTTALLATGTTFLMYYFNLAVLGGATVTLPFRLAGWIFYAREFTIPGLFALLTSIGVRIGKGTWASHGLFWLFVYSVIDGILRASKGSVALSMALVLFMFLSS